MNVQVGNYGMLRSLLVIPTTYGAKSFASSQKMMVVIAYLEAIYLR
jgi:hypothetical protein